MIRCFDSENIQNVNSDVNPVRDLEIIETEMKLADIESIEKQLDKKNKKKNYDLRNKILEDVLNIINKDINIEKIYDNYEKTDVNSIGLLSLKPKLFVCKEEEKSILNGNKYTKEFINKFSEKNTIIISAEIENQINQLDNSEKKNYMEVLGIKNTGLNMLIQKGRSLNSILLIPMDHQREYLLYVLKMEEQLFSCLIPKERS